MPPPITIANLTLPSTCLLLHKFAIVALIPLVGGTEPLQFRSRHAAISRRVHKIEKTHTYKKKTPWFLRCSTNSSQLHRAPMQEIIIRDYKDYKGALISLTSLSPSYNTLSYPSLILTQWEDYIFVKPPLSFQRGPYIVQTLHLFINGSCNVPIRRVRRRYCDVYTQGKNTLTYTLNISIGNNQSTKARGALYILI